MTLLCLNLFNSLLYFLLLIIEHAVTVDMLPELSEMKIMKLIEKVGEQLIFERYIKSLSQLDIQNMPVYYSTESNIPEYNNTFPVVGLTAQNIQTINTQPAFISNPPVVSVTTQAIQTQPSTSCVQLVNNKTLVSIIYSHNQFFSTLITKQRTT